MYSVAQIDLERREGKNEGAACAWYRISVLRHTYHEFDEDSSALYATGQDQPRAQTRRPCSPIQALDQSPQTGWQEAVAADLIKHLVQPTIKKQTQTPSDGFLHPDSLAPIEVFSDEHLARLLPSRAGYSLSDWTETQEQMRSLLAAEGSEGESLARVREAAAELSSSLSRASTNLLQAWDLRDLQDDTQEMAFEMLSPRADDASPPSWPRRLTRSAAATDAIVDPRAAPAGRSEREGGRQALAAGAEVNAAHEGGSPHQHTAAGDEIAAKFIAPTRDSSHPPDFRHTAAGDEIAATLDLLQQHALRLRYSSAEHSETHWRDAATDSESGGNGGGGGGGGGGGDLSLHDSNPGPRRATSAAALVGAYAMLSSLLSARKSRSSKLFSRPRRLSCLMTRGGLLHVN